MAYRNEMSPIRPGAPPGITNPRSLLGSAREHFPLFTFYFLLACPP